MGPREYVRLNSAYRRQVATHRAHCRDGRLLAKILAAEGNRVAAERAVKDLRDSKFKARQLELMGFNMRTDEGATFILTRNDYRRPSLEETEKNKRGPPAGWPRRLRRVSLFSFPFVSFLFKGNIPVGGVVIPQAPEVGQVIAEIDEIETRDPISIYLLLMNQFVPEQCRWDFRLTALEENRSSYYHSVVTSQERQLEDPVSVSDASNLARS
jgi:hypothetical protein